MNTLFRSPRSVLLGYPDPHEKWSEADLWEWVDAGKPGNPPWNPDGIAITVTPYADPAEYKRQQNAIIDASGNREVFDLMQRGKPGSATRVYINQVRATQKLIDENPELRQADKQYLRVQAAKRKKLIIGAGIGIAALLAVIGLS